MNIHDMITTFEGAKRPLFLISNNQTIILSLLARRLGHLSHNTDGITIALEARRAWPNVQDNSLARYIRQLRAVFNFHHKLEGVTSARDIPMPPHFDERDITASGKDLRTLLDYISCANPWAYPAILLLLHTGARLNEAMRIDVSRDYRDGVLTVQQPRAKRTKTVHRRVPATKRLREAIERGEMSAPVFVTDRGKACVSPDAAGEALRPLLARSCAAIGIDRLTLHDLRHGMAVLIAENNGDLSDIAAVLGHTNLSTTRRYRGLVLSRARKLFDAIA